MMQRLTLLLAAIRATTIINGSINNNFVNAHQPTDEPTTIRLAQQTLNELFLTSQNTRLQAARIAEEAAKADKDSTAAVDTDTDVTKADDENNNDPPNDPSNQHQQQILAASSDPNLHYDGSELIQWINENGGFIHPNVKIGLDPTGNYRGVFVKTVEEMEEESGRVGGIEEEDIICRIPW
eukprot:scaffold3091_cov186-Alexandrium_tamarense.AAC.13